MSQSHRTFEGKRYSLLVALALTSGLVGLWAHIPAARSGSPESTFSKSFGVRRATTQGFSQTASAGFITAPAGSTQEVVGPVWAKDDLGGLTQTQQPSSASTVLAAPKPNDRSHSPLWQFRNAAMASAVARAKGIAVLAAHPESLGDARTLFTTGDSEITPLVSSYLPISQEMHLAAAWNLWSETELESVRETATENNSNQPDGATTDGLSNRDLRLQSVASEPGQILADWLQLATAYARAAPVRGYLHQLLRTRVTLAQSARRVCERAKGAYSGAAIAAVPSELEQNLLASITWDVRLLDYLYAIFVWDDPELRFVPSYDPQFSAVTTRLASNTASEIAAYLQENCSLLASPQA